MSALAPALLDCLTRLLPGRGDAAQMARIAPLVTALAAALERGELALDLEAPPPEAIAAKHERGDWPEAQLAALTACGWLVDAEGLETRPEAPLVREGRWLRWRRWHQQLTHCRSALVRRSQQAPEHRVRSGDDPESVAQAIVQAAAQAAAAGLDGQQCRAVEALLQHRLVLLSGGPGTGKTSTVVQMLAAVLRRQPALRLHLAAPTGKAAARLAAAVAEGAAGLEPALHRRLPDLPCTTLHRLLEARGDGDGYRRGRRHPLELDLLVVDEVSMVDLPLMEALLDALPPSAQLLLVGDPAQLPPVGPGAVLLELCQPATLASLGPAAVELRTTYRNDGAIARLAAEVRRQTGGGEALLRGLRPALQQLAAADNLRWQEVDAGPLPAEALKRLSAHQQRLAALSAALQPADLEQTDTAAVQALMAELGELILLTPQQRGPWGVERVHRTLLGEAAQGPVQRWPLGTPVLNRRNLSEQGLANGDIGVLVPAGPEGSQERLVLFPGGRLLHPARLGAADPALALTVHKAQGSQYGEVLLLLPASPLSEARLLYTGLTRARRQAWLFTPAGLAESGTAA